MPNLYQQETFIDRTQNARFGESDVYETFTDDKGKLYRSNVREYGRCTGKVYIDTTDGSTKAIGWVFVSRQRYEDSPKETYLREVWVTVHEREPEKSVKYHYAE